MEAQFPETYSAGLLHDLGMLVLDRALGSQYKRVLGEARRCVDQVEMIIASG